MSNSPPTNEAGSPVPAKTTSGHNTPPTSTNILPPQHWAQLAEELDVQDDADSTLEGDLNSTASITSTILQYRTVNGRRYHSERGKAEYWGPNDEVQQEAMDVNHHVLTLLLGGKLYLAPLPKDVQTVLDVGTGTGIWAMDFADEFPNASVTGTDISPIQPHWVPPNLQFQIDDCTQEWTFPENSFDFVHMRWLVGSIADWTELFKQAYKCLKPGGYLESYEPSSRFESDDGSVLDSSALSQWGKFFVEGGRTIGRPFTVFEDNLQRKAMEEAGLVEIEEVNLKNPVGRWPADPEIQQIGAFMQLAFEQDAEGTVLFMASTQGWTKDEVAVYLTHFRREIRSKNIHGYYRQKVIWGRKPPA